DLMSSDARWDVILDSPGAHTFRQLQHLLTPNGVLVSTRPAAIDALRTVIPRQLRSEGKRYAAVMTRGISQDLAHLAALVDTGRLRPHVHRSYPMRQADQAHRHAEGTAVGKIVLQGIWT
ncbi:MAG TPA: zinc-binding dehydrogenase, partial [Propionibacteriaceae bacterium]